MKLIAVSLFVLFCLLIGSCSETAEVEEPISRLDSIPEDAVKMTPDTDFFPPVVHSDLWEQPVPLPGPVNTAGAEDAPVISADGSMLLFFFTPDVDVPPEQQILDGVTGIWWCTTTEKNWFEPERALLNDDLALDGSLCLEADTLWFCSVRTGNYREIDIYTAVFTSNSWADWQNAGYQLNVEYLVGELYTCNQGNTMIYDSNREGGWGGKDLWVIEKTGGTWSDPENLGPDINTEFDEGWPFVSEDGSELWYTAWSSSGYSGPAVFRSIRQIDDTWGDPEEIVSNFAGDPALDGEGNIYFTHHYYSEDNQMIEADIYVAYKK